jgi:hypothetical protein
MQILIFFGLVFIRRFFSTFTFQDMRTKVKISVENILYQLEAKSSIEIYVLIIADRISAKYVHKIYVSHFSPADML